MNHQRLLRILVAANILLAFGSAGAEGFFGWTLPSTLAEYNHERFAQLPWSNPSSAFHFVVLAVLCLCAFGAWIGLLTSWRLARRLYLASLALSVFQILLSGPVVMTSIGAAFHMLDGLVSGAVLGLVYCTDLARRFEKGPVKHTAAAAMHLDPGQA
jgi:hypothetical protein